MKVLVSFVITLLFSAAAIAGQSFVLITVVGSRVSMQEFNDKLNCEYAAGFVKGVNDDAIVKCVPK